MYIIYPPFRKYDTVFTFKAVYFVPLNLVRLYFYILDQYYTFQFIHTI